jgi:hypothetical protein
MIQRHRAAAAVISYLFLSCFLLLVAAQDPTHAITSFPNLPARLFFFDDTLVRNLHAYRGVLTELFK